MQTLQELRDQITDGESLEDFAQSIRELEDEDDESAIPLLLELIDEATLGSKGFLEEHYAAVDSLFKLLTRKQLGQLSGATKESMPCNDYIAQSAVAQTTLVSLVAHGTTIEMRVCDARRDNMMDSVLIDASAVHDLAKAEISRRVAQ